MRHDSSARIDGCKRPPRFVSTGREQSRKSSDVRYTRFLCPPDVPMSTEIEFVTADVFTDQRFGGNPLAVVPDGDGLTSQQMQTIANEFNLSETVFVLAPDDPANTARFRIFTPRSFSWYSTESMSTLV